MACAQFTTKSLGLRTLRHIKESEKYAAQTVWNKVAEHYVEYGKLTFIRLFDVYPSYKAFFMEMTGFEDPFDNPKFKKHMLHVLLPTLGGLIYHLDNADAVFEALKRLGIQHKKMEIGLSRPNVEHLGQCILWVVKQNIENYTEEQEKALTKILYILLDLFCSSLEGKTI